MHPHCLQIFLGAIEGLISLSVGEAGDLLGEVVGGASAEIVLRTRDTHTFRSQTTHHTNLIKLGLFCCFTSSSLRQGLSALLSEMCSST